MKAMAERLTVNPADLVRSAHEHDERAEGWHRLGANPPNDPDVLARQLSFIGHSFTEGLRAENARRARDAATVAAEYARDADALRATAADYTTTDEDGAGRVDAIQGGIDGRPVTPLPGGEPAQVRPQMPSGVGPDAPYIKSGEPQTQFPPGGGVQGPFDVPRSEPAQVRPAGHIEPIDPSAGDYDRLYPKIFPNPLPGQPGGGSWSDVAPSFGDAKHPPHGGLIPNLVSPGEYAPNSRAPGYTEVIPNAQGGYDIVPPGIDPTPGTNSGG